MTSPNPNEEYTLTDASAYLGISKAMFHKYRQKGHLAPDRRVGNNFIYRRRTLDYFARQYLRQAAPDEVTFAELMTCSGLKRGAVQKLLNRAGITPTRPGKGTVPAFYSRKAIIERVPELMLDSK